MKYLAIGIFAIIGILFSTAAQAQEFVSLDDFIEQIIESSDEEIDMQLLYDDLSFLLENPLDLNTCKRSDLEKIQFLSDLQIENILEYVRENDEMLTIYEMKFVEGFSPAQIQSLLPFVRIEKVESGRKLSLSKILRYSNKDLFLRSATVLEDQKGFAEPDGTQRYLGDQFKHLVKFKASYKNKFYAGFTAEKDVGEEFFTGTQANGFDYYSAHLQVDGIAGLDRIAAGDFQTQFGQGLVCWSGMGTSKSSYVLNIRKKARGLRRYSSTDENRFFRGGGVTKTFGNLRVTAFYSQKKVDANISYTDTSDFELPEVTSIIYTGIHATESAVEDKDAVDETIFGGNIGLKIKNINLGATFIGQKWSSPFSASDRPYNHFAFEGDENFNASFDYNAALGKTMVFGEVAMAQHGGWATLNGAVFHLAPRVGVSVLHRHFSEDYFAPYGNAFSEGSKDVNEDGLFVGIEAHPYQRWIISAYLDAYSFPWLRFSANAPSHGVDGLVQIDYSPAHYTSMYLRFKTETKAVNQVVENTQIVGTANLTKSSLRFHIQYRPFLGFTLKNRIQYSFSNEENEPNTEGFLLFQDISYKFNTLPLSIKARFLLFDIEDYNTRIYTYENDVLYSFSVPAMYGRGIRSYILVKYVFSRTVSCWLRFARTQYTDRQVNGSGLNEIDGSAKSEVRVQLRLRF